VFNRLFFLSSSVTQAGSLGQPFSTAYQARNLQVKVFTLPCLFNTKASFLLKANAKKFSPSNVYAM